MRKSLLLFITVASFCLCTTVIAQEPVSETLIREGVKLYDEDNYQEAIKLFRQVNENDSNYVWMLSELSMTFIQTKDYDSAIYYAEKGLQVPSGLKQHLMRSLGTAYDGAGHPDKSIEVYKEAIRLYPFSYLLHYNLGMTYLEVGDYPSAMKCFQESIRCNPFHASSHMRLGMLMARQENYTRALLSLETFLALEPQSERSNVILVYAENLSSGHLDTAYGEFIEPFADNSLFEELDGLIKAKLVLNDRYKPAIEFDANIVRQTTLLMEMLPFDDKTDDFWAEAYLPFFRGIKEGGHIEPFLYTILTSSGNKTVSKWTDKNKKALESFFNTGSNLSNIKKTRKVTINDREMMLTASYDDDGDLFSLGNRDDSGAETGQWQFYYPNGEIKSRGLFVNGKKNGEWRYYYDSGLPEQVEHYSNGQMNGEYITYHQSGKPNITGNFADGKVEGEVSWRNMFGITTKTLVYKNDTLEGEAKTFYDSAQPKEVYSLHNGEINGKHMTYYASGQEGIMTWYKSGSPHGEYLEYYSNGRLSVKGNYNEGKETGEWSYYYPNGRLKRIQSYSSGDVTGLVRTFYYNGMPETEENYNGSGKQEGLTSYFDHKGRKFLEEEYRDGLLIKITTDFNNPGKPAVFSSPAGTFSYKVYTAEGRLRSEGSYEKGKLAGDIKFYYHNGNLRQKGNLKTGQYDGEVVSFHPNGKTESVSYYKDGLLEGKYIEYGLDGTVLKTGYYLGNNMNNTWNYYTADGGIETTAYYLNGLMNGLYTNYSVDGKIKSRDRFTDGNRVSQQQYDPEGTIINNVNFIETDKYQIKSRNDIILADCSIKGGVYNGPLTWYHPGGGISTKMNFIADNQNGEYIQYYPDGTVLVRGQTENGNKEGPWITFSKEGHKTEDEIYFMDMKDSIHSFSYDDGSLRMTESYFNNKLDGPCTMYAPGGELMIKLYYYQGELDGYQYMKEGTLTNIIPIKEGDHNVVAWYDNGKKSYEQQFRNFVAEGPQIKYYPNGNIMQRRIFSNGMLNGKCEKYYPDGTPESLYYCKNGLYEGEFTEYNKSGTVSEKIQFLHDERNGERTLFDLNGKPVSREDYWSGSFIGFKQ